ncbi:MAG: arginine--tRNA ligase [Rhodospirillales bacterium]|nr:arginine--tRNA ligase [Rhodospirillales bacterium]MCB9996317.1 arginine--tRNA ligase [Rhodospirillales bacterium]
MSSLAEKLSTIVGAVFAAQDLPADLGVVRVSDRPDLAQFQCNGAMAAAKVAQKNPREIANDLVARLKENGDFAKIDIAGPGFINLDITDDYLAAHLAAVAADERLGVSTLEQEQTAVLDYGGPNIAKPMHVGHLRAAIIGDSLRRIMSFAGYKTLGDVHMGDWGTHMGMIISEYIKQGRAGEIMQIDLADDMAVDGLMQDLGEIYPKVAAACKEDDARKREAQDATVKIQNKEPQYFALWQKIKEASVIGMRNNYARLKVHFDLWKGEADVHDYIAPMVDDLKARNFAVEDQGALIVPVKRNDDNKEVPPLMLYKSDGGVMYGTTDLATIVERVKLYSPAKIVYFVDQRQHLHFEQVFRASRMAGIAGESVELTHAGFGTMNGPDGKPFKTRAGGVMRLDDLMSMAIDKARQRIDEAALAQDMTDDEKEDVAHKVAVAAIKFADLQNQRHSDYIFDLDRLTSFEGKTGPYMLYQAVRIKSLLKKAEAQGDVPSAGFVLRDEDRPLALLLTEMPDAFDAALRHYMPHHICEYAYKLANTFSSFYGSCHILSEEDEALKASRLALCALTCRQLETALSWLGIDVPERM